jgi:hypothetical protein
MPNLTDISNVRGSDLGRTALGLVLEESPLLRLLDQQSAFEEDATDFDYRTYAGSNAVQTRQRGGSYLPEEVAPGAKENGTLSFHGDKIDVDHSDQADADRGLRDLPTWLSKTMRKKLRRWVEGYEKIALQGSADSGGIVGLSEILDGANDVPGFNQTMVVDAADFTDADDNSFDLGAEANWSIFIEELIKLLARQGANAILMPPALYARMYTIAQEKAILGETRDQFGNPVQTFGNYPFVPLAPGSITTTEPDNASTANNTTTSLYPVRFGEGRVSLVTNSGLSFWDLGDLEGKESNRVKWEIRGQWKVEEENVIRRIRNVKL